MSAGLRRALYACMAALAATGILYAVPRYADLYFGRDWPPVAAPGLLMKAHGALAVWALLLLGGIWQIHVRARIRRPDNRAAGVALAAAMAVLAVTGWLLYYAGARGLREFSSLAHTACGVAVLVVMLWHVRRGRAILARRRGRRGPDRDRLAAAPGRAATPTLSGAQDPHSPPVSLEGR